MTDDALPLKVENGMASSRYPVWIDDALTAVERLRDAVGLSVRASHEPTAWPFASWDDLMSPQAWTMQVARTQLALARFYLGLAIDQARLA